MLGASQAAALSRIGFIPQSYGAGIVALSPIAYWRLGEAGGATIVDERAVQNGTYVGVVEYSVAAIVQRSGGRAIGFNGTDAYGQILHCPAFALASYTIDFAFQADTAPAPGANMVLLSKDRFPSPPDGGLSIELFNHAGQLKIRGYAGGTSEAAGWIGDPNGVAAVELHTSYKVTVTVDGTGARLYLDGDEQASAPNPHGWQSNGEPIILGAYSADALAKFDGVLDDVAIFDRALKPDEISTLAHKQTIQHPAPSSVSLTAPLEVFTPTEIQVTALAGWPAGRTPKAIALQGARAYGYVRRSWKASHNDSTWINFWPGWQPTADTDAINVTLDDGSTLDITYTVEGTIPTPSGGGATRYLDASAPGGGNGTAGAPWNSWKTAIEALTAGSVLVVKAKAGTRTLNGRAIPNSVYPVDVGATGSAVSTVNDVKIFADPVDLAAGRRPRIHINGGDLAGFCDDPHGMWEQDPGDPAGNAWRSVRSTYPSPGESVNAWYKGSTGRVCGLYDYFHPAQGPYLNQLRDTTYAKIDMYIGTRTQTYMGPGVTYNGGRYYVRLSPPHPSTVCKGSAPNPPWYWADYYPPDTNPNNVPLWFGTTGHGNNAFNSCLRITNRSGWKIYNLDFVPGGYGIEANGTTNLEIYGCRFFGVCHLEHIDTDNTNYQGKQVRADSATGLLFDRCEFYGGCPPWLTWSEGKGWPGAFGPSMRNAFAEVRDAFFQARHCRFENFYHLVWGQGMQSPKWHHCTFVNCGLDGLLVCGVPKSVTEIIRSQLLNSTVSGWAGGTNTIAAMHYIGNLEVRMVPGYASHRAAHVKTTSSGPPTALDCDYVPMSLEAPHGGVGGGGEPAPWFRCQNSILGTQRHRQSSTASQGTGATLSPHRANQLMEFGHLWWAQNNIAAVYPSASGYLWDSSDPAVGARDSFVTYVLESTGGFSHIDYNHYYRDSLMPNTGRSTLATVYVYNGSAINCADIAAIRAASAAEDHGTSGSPGWTFDFPSDGPDRDLYRPDNFLISVTNTAASGGNTGLSAQAMHDYDGNAQITYPGYSWRGCFVPGVPAVEQEVGPLGPMIT